MDEDIFDKNSEKAAEASAESPAFDSDSQEDTFNYNSIYGIPDVAAETDLERKRRNDEIMREIRREAEMKAIKEDIERRYAKELEAAQSKEVALTFTDGEAQQLITSQPDSEAEKPEEIPAEEIIEHSKDKKTKQKHKKTKKEHGGAYDVIYNFGDDITKSIGTVFMMLIRLIVTPIKAIYTYSEKATGFAVKRAKSYTGGFIKEMRHFRREIKSTSVNLRRALKHPTAVPSVLWYYIKKAYKRHRNMLRTLFNTALPVSALLIFAIVFNYWNGVTFALSVTYNDKNIGYISSEAVYLEAQELVKKKMDSGAFAAALSPDTTKVSAETATAEPDFRADYSLTLVSLEELNDAQTICDKVIENSSDNLTNACGVYVGGLFVCAVKNEADAKTVFYKIIGPYELEAETKGYVVGFAESIEYVQGLYPDHEKVMWDAARLETELGVEHEMQREYIVESGDSLESIADDFSITSEKLISLNPNVDWNRIHPDDKVTVVTMDKYIHIKKTVTTTTNETVKFDTVTSRDATKFSGYRKVTQAGVNGIDKVTTTETYIDDVLESREQDRDTLVAPIDEKIVIGTNTYYSGINVGTQSTKGFIWPAPSCHTVSSPYGQRSSGWHKGIDLIKGGGGASGTPVVASKSGRVEVVQYNSSGYGNMILINHGDGYKTRYAHMLNGSMRVSEGDWVEAGQQIGKVGSTGNSTGPHLHFEVIYNGNTQNPAKYIY